MSDLVPPKVADIVYETDAPVLYEADGAVAHVIMSRPGFQQRAKQPDDLRARCRLPPRGGR